MAFTKGNKFAFTKGMSGNPHGKPPLPDHLKKIPLVTGMEVHALISKYMRMTPADMALELQSKTLTILDTMILGIIQKVIDDKDHFRLEMLLNRTAGRVKEAPVVTPEATHENDLKEKLNLLEEESVNLYLKRVNAES